jgi:glycosyltransferase involved in cell wall biosynthesis
MRVAYLVTYYPRVSHTFIRREIAALEEQGIAVDRYAIRGAPDAIVDPDDQREAERTRVLLSAPKLELLAAILFAALGRPVRFLRALRLTIALVRASDRGAIRNFAYLVEACILLRWLARTDCSHVHAHFGTNSAAAAMLCHELGGPPYSFTVHGPDEFDAVVGLSLPEKIERARFVVAISSFGRSQLWRHSRYACWPKVQVVHCGLDGAFLDAEPQPIPEQPRLVSVGRITGQKGYPLLVEAAARLAAEGVVFELVLVGDGELRAELDAQVQRLGLTERVKLIGLADGERVRAELRAARAFVLPSFAEGLPVVVMEALALGRPVITTYVAGIPELVSSECGWLVPAGEVEPLVEAMRAALTAPAAQLAAMGRIGRERVRQRHDVRIESQKLRRLLLDGPVA